MTEKKIKEIDEILKKLPNVKLEQLENAVLFIEFFQERLKVCPLCQAAFFDFCVEHNLIHLTTTEEVEE